MVVNETVWIEGALPEPQFVEQIVEGAAMSTELPTVGP
jgi:hypothetical protein